jgi:hypothetical protein
MNTEQAIALCERVSAQIEAGGPVNADDAAGVMYLLKHFVERPQSIRVPDDVGTAGISLYLLIVYISTFAVSMVAGFVPAAICGMYLLWLSEGAERELAVEAIQRANPDVEVV